MSIFNVVGIAIGLAMDAVAVAIATSVALRHISGRQYFRLSFHFGLFQFLMPIIGWLAGETLAARFLSFSNVLAFLLLAFVGGKMIRESLRRDSGEDHLRGDPTRGLSLVSLSLATSMDALAVGISFALLSVDVWYPAVIIGLVAGVLTLIGMRLGYRLGTRFGHRMEILGGVILLGIGLRILLQSLI